MWFYGCDAYYADQALRYEIGYTGPSSRDPGEAEKPVVLPRFLGWVAGTLVLFCCAITTASWFAHTAAVSTTLH
jgi:hypothetical protein